MRIAGTGISLPGWVVGNEDVIDLVRQESAGLFEGDLEKALETVRFLLRSSGARTRRWSRPEDRAIDHLKVAAAQAFEEAGCGPEDVDLLVYTGIGRGFLEPGGSYFVAKELGMRRAHCFDIMDACMSWTRAAQVVESLLRTGTYRRAIVVNAEFILRKGPFVYPENFRLRKFSDISYLFAAFSGGEAASATIFEACPATPWKWSILHDNSLCDLCTVAIDGWEQYCEPSDRIARAGLGKFTTFASELQAKGTDELLRSWLELEGDPPSLILPHTATTNAWESIAGQAGVSGRLFHVFPEHGNVGSASIPLALRKSVEAKRLSRGQVVDAWIASAGMSFAAYRFTY